MLSAGLAVLAALAFAGTASATTPPQNGRIVFGADATGSSQLYTVGPYGGRHQLTHVNGDAVAPDWSPNGRRIVFTNNADNLDKSANIGIVRPDGGCLRWLTHYTDPDVRGYVGGYSPDGRWIVFRLEDHGKFALMRMHPDGSHKRVILPLSDFRPRFIDWGTHS